MKPLTVVFLVYPGVTQLDFTGPAQVLSRLGRTSIHCVWKTLEAVPTDSGFSILPSGTLADCRKADIVCVPGGPGCHDVMEDEAVLAWLRKVTASADWVTSVCTGSLILAAAGLLNGYKAGCHWMWRDYLALFGAQPVDERVVFDRNRATGGGVTAGIDFGLALTAAIRGEEHAKLVQLSLEYDPSPPFDAGSPAKAGDDLVEKVKLHARNGLESRTDRVKASAARLAATRICPASAAGT